MSLNDDDQLIIDVSCAIIELNSKILVVQRGPKMDLPFKWELAGGKVEKGETPKECLIREIKEELGLEIKIHHELPSNTHHYSPGKTIRLIPFYCTIVSGELSLKEHTDALWLTKPELLKLEWAEADIPIVTSYIASD